MEVWIVWARICVPHWFLTALHLFPYIRERSYTLLSYCMNQESKVADYVRISTTWKLHVICSHSMNNETKNACFRIWAPCDQFNVCPCTAFLESFYFSSLVLLPFVTLISVRENHLPLPPSFHCSTVLSRNVMNITRYLREIYQQQDIYKLFIFSEGTEMTVWLRKPSGTGETFRAFLSMFTHAKTRDLIMCRQLLNQKHSPGMVM